MARKDKLKFANTAGGLGALEHADGDIQIAAQGLTYVSEVINASSATGWIFTAPVDMEIIAVRENHSVAGGASAAVDIKIAASGTAPSSGTSCLTGTMDLTATANTVITGALSTTQSALDVPAGSSIAVVFSGTLTGLVGVVTIMLKRKL